MNGRRALDVILLARDWVWISFLLFSLLLLLLLLSLLSLLLLFLLILLYLFFITSLPLVVVVIVVVVVVGVVSIGTLTIGTSSSLVVDICFTENHPLFFLLFQFDIHLCPVRRQEHSMFLLRR